MTRRRRGLIRMFAKSIGTLIDVYPRKPLSGALKELDEWNINRREDRLEAAWLLREAIQRGVEREYQAAFRSVSVRPYPHEVEVSEEDEKGLSEEEFNKKYGPLERERERLERLYLRDFHLRVSACRKVVERGMRKIGRAPLFPRWEAEKPYSWQRGDDYSVKCAGRRTIDGLTTWSQAKFVAEALNAREGRS